jgi:hypothetical protein
MNNNPIAVCFYVTDHPTFMPYWTGWFSYDSNENAIRYMMEKGYPKQFAYAEGDREQILKEAGIQ